MSAWRVLEVGAVAIATVVAGMAGGVACAWLLARVGRRVGTDPVITGLIAQKGAQRLYEGLDEDARRRSDRRRQRAEELHRDSVRIRTTDDHHGDWLRRVK